MSLRDSYIYINMNSARLDLLWATLMICQSGCQISIFPTNVMTNHPPKSSSTTPEMYVQEEHNLIIECLGACCVCMCVHMCVRMHLCMY